MEKRAFQTESKRILDLMIHSVYTHKEIFLRELISNASDALDKLYFRSLTDDGITQSREDYQIRLTADKEARTLTITDNGCGMSREDLEKNLGVIAHSGTLHFREEGGGEGDSGIETIGQFGVGFYSAFMAASRVRVESRVWGAEEAFAWESEGTEGYTIQPCEKADHGTVITLWLKENAEEENYDEYLESYKLRELVKKHSDFIRYPIRTLVQRSRPKEDNKEEYESYTEEETLNSMIPLWRKDKADITPEDYAAFYQQNFHDYEEPLLTIHYQVEGAVTFQALLFIPKNPPHNFYSKEFEKGLRLYTKGVTIMERCASLLPDHFSFVRGLVDSQDVSLNISREMLQHDRSLSVMQKNIEKKIRSELEKLLRDDREKYETFFASFGLQLKFGLYNEFGAHKDALKDLCLFLSLAKDKPISLKEYVEAMTEEQKHIYYVSAESAARAAALPQTERLRDKGYDVLCLREDVDEFALRMLRTYEEHELRNVSGEELELDEEEKKTQETRNTDNKDLLEAVKTALDGQVGSVVVSARLKRHPVCLSTEGGLSLEMEKVLNAMPAAGGVKATRILELNAEHPVFETLQTLHNQDEERLALYSRLLYAQALLIEGLNVEDPVALSSDICNLM